MELKKMSWTEKKQFLGIKETCEILPFNGRIILQKVIIDKDEFEKRKQERLQKEANIDVPDNKIVNLNGEELSTKHLEIVDLETHYGYPHHVIIDFAPDVENLYREQSLAEESQGIVPSRKPQRGDCVILLEGMGVEMPRKNQMYKAIHYLDILGIIPFENDSVLKYFYEKTC